MHASFVNFHFPSIQVYFSPSDNLIQNVSKPTIASYSVKERRSHTAMVAKFLGLNKLWSCQYGGEKTTKKFFLCTIVLRNERVTGIFLPSLDNTNGRPSLSRKVIDPEILLPWLHDITHLSIEAIFCGLFDNNNRSPGILKQIQCYWHYFVLQSIWLTCWF